MRQTKTREGALIGIPASTVINMLDDLIGKRSVAQFRKISKGVVRIVVNKIEGNQQLVQKIWQRWHDSAAVTWDYCRGKLSSDSQKMGNHGKKRGGGARLMYLIRKLQPSWGGKQIPKHRAAKRIVCRINVLSTVAVVVFEKKEMPATVLWDRKPQTLEPYILRGL